MVPLEQRPLTRALALVLDAAVLVLLASVFALILLGPGVHTVAGIHLSLRTATNPVTFALILAAVRLSLASGPGLLGDAGSRVLAGWRTRLTAWVLGEGPLSGARLTSVVVSCTAVSVGARLFQAWLHPGFVTGDDVEIHEMTLGRLFGTGWEIWQLRSALYPILFIFPVQALLHAAGVSDVQTLVFAGRAVVALMSGAAIWLTWYAARPLIGERHAAIAAALVAVSKLHVSYGSSELPRPVASALLAGAFAILVHGSTSRAAAGAAALVGFAGALRFSEVIFIAAGALQLWLHGRRMNAVAFSLVAAAVTLGTLAVADLLYWGSPLFSLRHAVQFTLVERLSSRGFEPFHYYVTAMHHWTNWVIVFFALAALRLPSGRIVSLWVWLPVALLSALPHKEPRYLIPVIPFLSICAAAGVAVCARALRDRRAAATAWSLFAAALLAAVLYEAGEWRLRRSDDGVALARFVARADPAGGVAVEQLWRAGGALYLSRPLQRRLLVNIDEGQDVQDLAARPDLVWLGLRTETVSRGQLDARLAALGWRPRASFGEYQLFSRPAPDTTVAPRNSR